MHHNILFPILNIIPLSVLYKYSSHLYLYSAAFLTSHWCICFLFHLGEEIPGSLWILTGNLVLVPLLPSLWWLWWLLHVSPSTYLQDLSGCTSLLKDYWMYFLCCSLIFSSLITHPIWWETFLCQSMDTLYCYPSKNPKEILKSRYHEFWFILKHEGIFINVILRICGQFF